MIHTCSLAHVWQTINAVHIQTHVKHCTGWLVVLTDKWRGIYSFCLRDKVPPEPADDPAHRWALVSALKCMVDACAPLFSNDGTVRSNTKDTHAMLALLMQAVLCVCVCLDCLKFWKSPLLTRGFFSVRCATRGIWLGWNAAVAKTFYKIKSFHCCCFFFWMLFSSCCSDPNIFCHRSDHMIVIFQLLPRWHVSQPSHIVSTVICPQMLLTFFHLQIRKSELRVDYYLTLTEMQSLLRTLTHMHSTNTCCCLQPRG